MSPSREGREDELSVTDDEREGVRLSEVSTSAGISFQMYWGRCLSSIQGQT